MQVKGQLMDVTIDGKHQLIPKCICGKCIVRRLRKDNFGAIPYNKDLATTYKDDYDWKTNVPEDPNKTYNRAKHNSFEGAYKEHIPTSLISTQKMDFKPFKVKEEKKKKDPEDPFKIPFQGRSTYIRHYPDWGAMTPVPDSPEDAIPDINVPLRGNSNYKESYPRYDPKFYTSGDPLNFAKSTLKFYGDLDPRTTYGENFKPVDFSNKNYFPDEIPINTAQGENTVLNPAPNAPGNMKTTYRRDYIKYDDKICPCRRWLNERNMRYLVI